MIRLGFESEAPFPHRMKANFFIILWSWTNLYRVDNTNSLLDLWLGWGIVEFEGCM